MSRGSSRHPVEEHITHFSKPCDSTVMVSGSQWFVVAVNPRCPCDNLLSLRSSNARFTFSHFRNNWEYRSFSSEKNPCGKNDTWTVSVSLGFGEKGGEKCDAVFALSKTRRESAGGKAAARRECAIFFSQSFRYCDNQVSFPPAFSRRLFYRTKVVILSIFPPPFH